MQCPRPCEAAVSGGAHRLIDRVEARWGGRGRRTDHGPHRSHLAPKSPHVDGAGAQVHAHEVLAALQLDARGIDPRTATLTARHQNLQEQVSVHVVEGMGDDERRRRSRVLGGGAEGRVRRAREIRAAVELGGPQEPRGERAMLDARPGRRRHRRLRRARERRNRMHRGRLSTACGDGKGRHHREAVHEEAGAH